MLDNSDDTLERTNLYIALLVLWCRDRIVYLRCLLLSNSELYSVTQSHVTRPVYCTYTAVPLQIGKILSLIIESR